MAWKEKTSDEQPPNPGSEEAIKKGCTCPVMDNYHGKGIPIKGKICFWTSENCPLHGQRGGKK